MGDTFDIPPMKQTPNRLQNKHGEEYFKNVAKNLASISDDTEAGASENLAFTQVEISKPKPKKKSKKRVYSKKKQTGKRWRRTLTINENLDKMLKVLSKDYKITASEIFRLAIIEAYNKVK